MSGGVFCTLTTWDIMATESTERITLIIAFPCSFVDSVAMIFVTNQLKNNWQPYATVRS